MLQRHQPALIAALWAGFFALVQVRLIHMLFLDQYEASVDASMAVLTGHPLWRVFQSRLLGPILIAAIEQIVHSPRYAYALFSIAALAIAGFIAWRLGRRIGGDARAGFLALLIFELGFACLLSSPWLYAWDYLGVIVFLLWVDFVFAGRPWPWFVALFAVAIFNRESALFIALWMVIDPLARWVLGRARVTAHRRLDWPLLVAGLACFAAGTALVEFLRNALLIEERGPIVYPAEAAYAGAQAHWRLADNLHSIARAMTSFEYYLGFVVVFFLLILIGLMVRLAWLDPERWSGLALTYLALLASLIVFGVVFETRIYVEFIPLAVAGGVILTLPAPERRRQRRPG
jgi:hypothetical protein